METYLATCLGPYYGEGALSLFALRSTFNKVHLVQTVAVCILQTMHSPQGRRMGTCPGSNAIVKVQVAPDPCFQWGQRPLCSE